MTARAQTHQRREKMLKLRRGTVGDAEEQLPIVRQVVQKICQGVYGHGQCACAKAPDKPACSQMEGTARHIVETVRRFDLKAREAT